MTVGCAGGTGPVYEGGCCVADGEAKLLLSTEEWEGTVGAVDREEKTLGGKFAEAPPIVGGTVPRV